MSHFNVMVMTTDDSLSIEELLEPYYEGNAYLGSNLMYVFNEGFVSMFTKYSSESPSRKTPMTLAFAYSSRCTFRLLARRRALERAVAVERWNTSKFSKNQGHRFQS